MEHIDLDSDVYVWCWSHGKIHLFAIGAPWCFGMWERLNGTTEKDALKDKVTRFGPYQFDNIVGSDADVRYSHEIRVVELYFKKIMLDDGNRDHPDIDRICREFVYATRSNPRYMGDIIRMYETGALTRKKS